MILEKTNHVPIDFSKVINYLKLGRYLAMKGQPVVWHLAIIYDLGSWAEHYYLDPITGEIPHLAQDLPTPTRSLTRTP